MDCFPINLHLAGHRALSGVFGVLKVSCTGWCLEHSKPPVSVTCSERTMFEETMFKESLFVEIYCFIYCSPVRVTDIVTVTEYLKDNYPSSLWGTEGV